MDTVRVNANMRLQEQNHLGISRACLIPNSFCLLPKAFIVPGPLPEWELTKAYFLASPSMGARFLECRLHLFPGGGTKEAILSSYEHYMYVLSGSVEVTIQGKRHTLEKEGFFWLPPMTDFEVKNTGAQELDLLWIRKKYQTTKFYPVPAPVVSSVLELPAVQTPAERIQECLPERCLGYDMAVNVMTFDPGVTFPRTEIHVFEHGEYFLRGRGLLWVNGSYYETMEDDFAFISAYSPHFVAACGPEPMTYLLYKDLSRDYEL